MEIKAHGTKCLTSVRWNCPGHRASSLRNCQSHEKPETGRPKVVWGPGGDPGTEKEHEVKKEGNLNRGRMSVNDNVSMWFMNCDKCVTLTYAVRYKGNQV